MSNDHLKPAQVFTPSNITNEMLDLIDQSRFADHETFFFEPSCGDGEMLVVILERIFNMLNEKYQDKEQAMADTLFKFYAIELDDELVPKARMRIFEWVKVKLEREIAPFEMYMVARSLQQSIEHRDFFEVMKGSIDSPGKRKMEGHTRKVSKKE